jgi:DNA adenine methylase
MGWDDHRELLDVLRSAKGKVMLCGYPSELYDAALRGWNRREFDVANHGSSASTKPRKMEIVWCNY